VTREALRSPGEAGRVAADAAYAVALFEQRGCVSPHVVWVETGGEVSPRRWSEILGEALAEVEALLPAAPLQAALAAEIQQLRAAAELRAAAGSGDLVRAGTAGGWTVLFEPADRPIETSGGRTVRVRPIDGLGGLSDLLRPYGPLLQSIAVAGPASSRKSVASALARSGITRVTGFRDQPWPPPWWRHDGQGPLLALVRWVGVENEHPDSENAP
jgi:hypothetical protein